MSADTPSFFNPTVVKVQIGGQRKSSADILTSGNKKPGRSISLLPGRLS
jgi:hypothetical protein